MNPPKLFAITNTIEHMTPEESICYMARVSSPQNQDNHATHLKLLTFLMENGHWSPFDMIDMILEIQTSRAIMAQILRHFSFKFQEHSQRYSEVERIDWEHLEARMKADGGNRQGSGELADNELQRQMDNSAMASEAGYQYLISKGIAPESARMILPLGTPTRAYMKGSVRSWITYFWQRLDKHAQKEHRELAEQMFEIFKEQFPALGTMVKRGRMRYVLNDEKV